MTSKLQVKKEFEAFAKKIAKLESLRNELEALDSKGFENDVRVIKAKLHNVNAIPEIEREIDALRRKISSRSLKRPRLGIPKSLIKDSRSLKKDTQLMKKKIEEIEKILNKKRKVSSKKQLSKNEVSYVKDIPQLEGELRRLRKAFEKHTKATRVKIDSGVGTLVDTKFDDFIIQIKGELSERLKEKESVIDSQLKSDLEARETLFARKYDDLVKEFHDRYKEELNNHLKKEVKEKFEGELQRKLSIEEKRLVDSLIKEHARRLSSDRRRMIYALESDYLNKEKKMRNKMNRELKELKDDLNRKGLSLKERNERLRNREIEIERKFTEHQRENNIEFMERVDEMRKKMHLELVSKIGRMKAQIRRKAMELSERSSALSDKEKKLDSKFSEKVAGMKASLENELKLRTEEIKEKDEKWIQSELREKGKEIRENLGRKYHDKLRNEMKKKEAALNSKKAELEKHVMQQAKKLFH